MARRRRRNLTKLFNRREENRQFTKPIVVIPSDSPLTFNGVRKGFKHENKSHNLYYLLMHVEWNNYFLIVLSAFFGLHALFAFLLWIVPDSIHHDGDAFSLVKHGSFTEAFLFSIHTITSIGYGALYPHSLYANAILSMEEFFNWFFVSSLIGVTYSKFSRPKPTIRLSKDMCMTDTKEDKFYKLHAKMVNLRKDPLTDAEVTISFEWNEMNQRWSVNLPCREPEKLIVSVTWDLEHIIDHNSPLYGVSYDELVEKDAEVVVTVTATESVGRDMVWSQFRYSMKNLKFDYHFVNDIVWNHHDIPVFNLKKFDEIEKD
eukprot:TRINITY_DN9_c0_g1_i1.p1 TRINITY_DN9_c0_g1~~TRINITY_DN9_c0_g1_i1.p1  ORF type:complete len:317 (-),score=57.25 TRINITY_DN9_c0_g1_i1:24-974(-)